MHVYKTTRSSNTPQPSIAEYVFASVTTQATRSCACCAPALSEQKQPAASSRVECILLILLASYPFFNVSHLCLHAAAAAACCYSRKDHLILFCHENLNIAFAFIVWRRERARMSRIFLRLHLYERAKSILVRGFAQIYLYIPFTKTYAF